MSDVSAPVVETRLHMDAPTCRVCKYQTKFIFARRGFRWLRCGQCRTLQKALSEVEYQTLNPTYDPGVLVSPTASEPEYREALGVPQKRKFLRELGCQFFPQARALRFLDIGCGAGGYLLAARELGWSIQGVEPSAAHASVAITRFRLPIITALFSAELFAHPFDMVMISHVIEHIYAPKQFLTEVSKVMARGSVIVVVTPNSESLCASLSGRLWSMLKPIDHVTLLSKTALQEICPEGFRVGHLRTSEYPSEFLLTLLSALKEGVVGLRSRSLNHLQSSTGQPRRTVTAPSFPNSIRAVLGMLSLPLYVLGTLLDRRACLVAIYQRTRD
jgi:SAM-dependent methyltransferase